MKSILSSIILVSALGCAFIAPQAIGDERIDLSQAKLLLEVTETTTVSKKVISKSSTSSVQARCNSIRCEESEEQEEIVERRTEERWWEDDHGDEWYEKSEYHKYDGGDIWELVFSTKAKSGSSGFVPRPKG